MKNTAIVLAGGSGSRMKSDCPKQYLLIGDKPVLFYSLRVFEECAAIDEIVLVTRKEDVDYCKKDIVDQYSLKKVKQIIVGGRERFESVGAGVNAVKEDGLVIVHDGARPCLRLETLNRLIKEAEQYGNASAAVPSKDTVRLVDSEGCVIFTPKRSEVWNMQTPQIFPRKILLEAYMSLKEYGREVAITDDAGLVERFTDCTLHISMGDYENIKITTPEDLKLACELILNRQK